MVEKIAIKLIDVSNWATSALIWAVGERLSETLNSYLFRIDRITDDNEGVKKYVGAIDGSYPAVLYFCGNCGTPLWALFCECPGCGIEYAHAVPDEKTICLRTLDRKLPQAIISAHNAEVFGDVRGRPRCEWEAPKDPDRQLIVNLPTG